MFLTKFNRTGPADRISSALVRARARVLAAAVIAALGMLAGLSACTASEPPAEGPVQGRWLAVEAIRHTYNSETKAWETTVHRDLHGNQSFYVSGDWILEIFGNGIIVYNYLGGTSGIDTTTWNAQRLPDGRSVFDNLDTMTFALKRDTLTVIHRQPGDPLADRTDWRLVRYTDPAWPDHWEIRIDSSEYIKHRLWKPALLVRHGYDFDNNQWKVDSFGAGSSWISANRIIKVHESHIIDYEYRPGGNPRIDSLVWNATRVGYSRWIERGIDTLIMAFRGDSMTFTQLPNAEDPTRSRYDWVYLKHTGAFPPPEWVVADTSSPPGDSTGNQTP